MQNLFLLFFIQVRFQYPVIFLMGKKTCTDIVIIIVETAIEPERECENA